MRTRLSFVANSSSSSFVIFGKYILKEELGDAFNRGEVLVKGKWLAEGEDIFLIDEKILKLILSGEVNDADFEYIEGFGLTGEVEIEIADVIERMKNLPEGSSIIVEERDDHSTNDIDQFKELYCGGEK